MLSMTVTTATVLIFSSFKISSIEVLALEKLFFPENVALTPFEVTS